MGQLVLYKGKMVSAQTIDIGNGKTKLIPIVQNIVHDIPTPSNMKIPGETKETAERIIRNSKNIEKNDDAILIEYIRKGQNGYILQNRDISDDITEYFIGKGEPYGVIVAFIYKGKLKIGWSKRLEGETIDNGKTKQLEPLIFTKKNAINLAVVRGLIDSIAFRGSSAYTSMNGVLPKSITKILQPFIKRAQTYFKQKVANCSYPGKCKYL